MARVCAACLGHTLARPVTLLRRHVGCPAAAHILLAAEGVLIVARQEASPDMNHNPAASTGRLSDRARGVESLLWLAAGAAWAIVVLRAWNKTKKVDARRRTFSVSDRLLQQVFPNDIRR
jgi:hypothetical protein